MIFCHSFKKQRNSVIERNGWVCLSDDYTLKCLIDCSHKKNILPPHFSSKKLYVLNIRVADYRQELTYNFVFISCPKYVLCFILQKKKYMLKIRGLWDETPFQLVKIWRRSKDRNACFFRNKQFKKISNQGVNNSECFILQQYTALTKSDTY
jgi:hypothetical protein